MTEFPKPTNEEQAYQAKYDAWNRLVELKDGSNLVQTNEFDGLGRRIVRSVYAGGSLDHRVHYYYNENWQILEERKEISGSEYVNPLNQYVWHSYYIDALAVRWYDSDVTTSGGDVQYYALQDANFNVTAVVNASGTVLERYQYSPYGQVTFLDSSFAPRSSSLIGNTHLYTGRELDPETGLQLNRHRYYATHLGRWTSRDPGGMAGGPIYGSFGPEIAGSHRIFRFTAGMNHGTYRLIGRDPFALYMAARQIYGGSMRNPVFDSGYVDGMNLYAGYHAMWGGTDPYGLGFWQGCKDYWYYLWHPSEMDQDLQTAQKVCVEVSVTCATTAVGVGGAAHLSKFKCCRFLNKNPYIRIGPGRTGGGWNRRIVIGGGKGRVHIPITRPKPIDPGKGIPL